MLKRAALTLWHALTGTFRRGFAALLLAPLTVALVVIPEFAQHVVEIQGGMFDSRAAGHAFANDPQRWAFGYVKLTGLALAFLATARFWWTRENGGRWWRLDEIAWDRFIPGLLLFLGLPAPVALLDGRIDPVLFETAKWTVTLLTLPFVFLTLAGLFGDRTISIRGMVTRSWPWLPLLIVLLVAAFAPPQLLHGLLHKWSIGQPKALVWALMTLDSLVVGLLASLTGAAFHAGYSAMAARLRIES
jgi:hypothetical protein